MQRCCMPQASRLIALFFRCWSISSFPLLVYIERKGPIGVGELADIVGRDYTTVNRQVAKLEEQGFISRHVSRSDSRVNEAMVTAKGRTLTDALDRTRQQLA
jgi:DNA-binding MarR family transcriptional regulator